MQQKCEKHVSLGLGCLEKILLDKIYASNDVMRTSWIQVVMTAICFRS